jgi:hypothetical protein
MGDNDDNRASSLRLPIFWADNTEAWFAVVETRFRLKHIDDEQEQFDHVVNALPKESLRVVLDLVTHPPEDNPYTAIKDRLCAAHQLTDFQRVEKLFQMDSLGGRKPSELLTEMMEMCPTGHEASPFFLFLFLQRLPKELRIMLGEDDHLDLRATAAKADKLWAVHGHQQHGTVAAVEPSSQFEPPAASVAAVRGGFIPRANKSGAQRGKGRGRGGHSKAASSSLNAGAAVYTPPPAALARQSAGLCFYHWSFGDKADKCEGICSWQGN